MPLCLTAFCFSHAWAETTDPYALEYALTERDSATETLQQKCTAPVHVRLLTSKPGIPAGVGSLLHIKDQKATSLIHSRHIQLLCRQTILSEAWNFYIPSRLTAAARQKLADGNTPFGRAVGEAFFFRQRLATRYTNLPAGTILENRALLHRRSDQLPIALVIEHYSTVAAKTQDRH